MTSWLKNILQAGMRRYGPFSREPAVLKSKDVRCQRIPKNVHCSKKDLKIHLAVLSFKKTDLKSFGQKIRTQGLDPRYSGPPSTNDHFLKLSIVFFFQVNTTPVRKIVRTVATIEEDNQNQQLDEVSCLTFSLALTDAL